MVLKALLVTLFWFGFLVVGLQILQLIEKKWAQKPISSDSLIRVFLALCLGFAAFTPIALFGYAFSAPIEPITLSWLAIILTSVAKTYKEPSEVKRILNDLRSKKYIWLLVAVVATDYAVSLYLGGYFSGDAWVHISRINDILQNGFTITDPYFPQLIDARYNLSFAHAFYAVGASATSLDAMGIWYLSLSFFRMAMTLSTYVVMKLVTNNKLLAATTSAVTIIILSFNWRFVLYPNQLVFVWFVFMAFGLMKLLAKPNNTTALALFLSGVVLIGFTHSAFAIGAAAFTATAYTIYVIQVKKFNIRLFMTMMLGAVLLSTPAIYGALIPARRPTNGRPVEGETVSVLGIDIANPALSYNFLYLVVLSTILLFFLRKKQSRAVMSVVFAAILTYPLISFTPIFEIVNDYLSNRMIRRYKTGTNFLSYTLTVSTAILLATYWMVVRIKPLAKISGSIIIALTLILVLIYSDNAKKYFGTQRGINNNSLALVNKLDSLLPDEGFSKTDVVVASERVNYYIPAFSNYSVVKIRNSHAPPSADPGIREACLAELFSKSDRVRLAAISMVKPSFYVLEEESKNLADEPELVHVSSSKGGEFFGVYEVDYTMVENYDNGSSSTCAHVVNGNA